MSFSELWEEMYSERDIEVKESGDGLNRTNSNVETLSQTADSLSIAEFEENSYFLKKY